MALKQGEVYKCSDPDCGCEITVSKGAAPGKGGNLASAALLLRQRDGQEVTWERPARDRDANCPGRGQVGKENRKTWQPKLFK